MKIALHANATTTPAIRAAIRSSREPDSVLMARYGISRRTVRRWRERESVLDRSHTAHQLQTTLNAGQEEVVVYLRQQLLLPLDDLLVVVQEFLHPAMRRAALHRLLVRRGLSRRPVPEDDKPAHKPFKDYAPGYLHMDVKYLPKMADEEKHRYVFVAIDRATRWVFIALYAEKTAANARRFLRNLHKAIPFKPVKLLTDNGKEFTDRLFGKRAKAESGSHPFDALCASLGIEHRLTKPRTPQTNGMVERFNGRLAEVLNTHRFDSAEDLETTLHRYVWLYNNQIPQKALHHQSPIQAMREWEAKIPKSFIKGRMQLVANRPRPDK